MHLSTIKTSFLLLLTISISHLIYSQEQTGTPILQEKPEEPVTYKVSEIPTKLEETTTYLTKLNVDIIYPEALTESDEELELVKKAYTALRHQTDSLNLEDEFSTTLKEFQQKWNNHKKKVTEWTSIVTERTESLEEEKKGLLETKEIWERTIKLAQEEEAPKEIRNSIRQIQVNINKAEKDLTKEINVSLSLQTKLSEQNIDIELTLTEIEELLKEKERKIFIRNALPFWGSSSDTSATADTTTLTLQFGQIWDSYIRTSEDFIKTNKEHFIEDILLFLLFSIFVFSLRHFSKSIKGEDDKVLLALRILERPFSTSVIVFLLFSIISYSEAPEIFFSALRIIVMFPLLRILVHIINPVLRTPMFFFATLVILQQFKQTAGSGTPIERTLLTIITVLAVAGLGWFLYKKVFRNAFELKLHQRRVESISKFMLGLFVISFIANALGYVMLGLVLVNGTLNSIYGITLLITATLALNAIIIITLQTKLAQKFRIVQHQSSKIKNTTAKIIKLIAIVWSFYIILNNFGIAEIFIEWLTETLSKEWVFGSLSISIGSILLFFISIWIAVLVARLVRFLLEGDILPRLNLARGVPGAISAITSYLIIGFGILVALIAAGIDLSSFALLAGALGVGIGFGMQDLVNNFISGLILIFERPIQVGDAVSVADISGKIKSIGIRSSIIRNWSGADIVVPNGQLISNKLTNWTMSDRLRRIEIKVGVKYGSDVEKVMEVLLQCAKDHKQILVNPAPFVLFTEFADSYLEFDLRSWTSNYGDWIDIRSEIHVAIDKAFKKEGIEIPFPQRDIHIISDFSEDQES
ncbi:MAG: hypothetical protein DRQ13_09565, partial [Ignavibacteriae bacterium]